MGDTIDTQKNSFVKATDSSSIAREIHTFIQQIESLATAIPFVSITIHTLGIGATDAFNKFLEKHGTATTSSNGVKSYNLPPDCTNEADKLKRECDNLRNCLPIIIRQFVVSLISQYDAFLGRLLRCLFYLQPSLLNATELSLSFAQLLELNSLENARDYLVEREVEKVLRMSHGDQFKWMESKFAISLRKDLPSWATFIEVTERRNLFVHCEGIVSRQYLEVCKDHGVSFDKEPALGERLLVPQTYLDNAYRCVFEIAVKLSQVLWRKLAKDNLNPADSSLIDITFDLICIEQYDLALTLLEFGTKVLKHHSSERNRRTLIINQAQAYKWTGKTDKCNELLGQEDWSACETRFRLAVDVLQDDFKSAAACMRKLDKNDMHDIDYKDWPIFKEFRKSEDFLKAFQEVYSKPFSTIITTASPSQTEPTEPTS